MLLLAFTAKPGNAKLGKKKPETLKKKRKKKEKRPTPFSRLRLGGWAGTGKKTKKNEKKKKKKKMMMMKKRQMEVSMVKRPSVPTSRH